MFLKCYLKEITSRYSFNELGHRARPKYDVILLLDAVKKVEKKNKMFFKT